MTVSSRMSYRLPLTLLSAVLSSSAFATGITTPQTGETQPKLVEPPTPQEVRKENLPAALPSAQPEQKIVLTPQYLQEHPQELESMLSVLVKNGNAHGLKLLLPIYREVQNRDESLIQWGEAIIALNEGNLSRSIELYRQINAALPHIKLLRFQMAVALFQDGQYEAAQDQFQKLRSEEVSTADGELIDKYLMAIRSRNRWSFNGTLSYVNEKNINGAPPENTQIVFPNGSSVTTNSKPEGGQGFSYSFAADKKWALNDRAFTAFHLSNNGTYYWNNKRFNDITGRIGWGVGYNSSRTEVELIPFVQRRWYGGGSNGGSSLKSYATTPGVRLEASYWLTPGWKYQGALEYGKDKYASAYQYMNGGNYTLSNTFLMIPNQNRFWFLGWDLSKKDARDPSNAYFRTGLRIGWGQEWAKGISTRVTAGYAKRRYKGEDFFGIQQVANEYNTSVSVWHRAIHFWGITPRLVWAYNKVDGNQPFYNYDNHKVFLDFSKTF